MNRRGNGGEFHIVWSVVTLSLVSRCHLTETDVLLVLQAISNPRSDDHQDRAWQSVVPLVSQLKQYYDFSISLGNSDAVIQSGTEKSGPFRFVAYDMYTSRIPHIRDLRSFEIRIRIGRPDSIRK